ncbi:hypothetical protein ASE07_24995 [Noviherbaspirillum sp. Root189]|nr:hypothetical protein ASE07_24995 [Noviherbaspirillum sp. Root189]
MDVREHQGSLSNKNRKVLAQGVLVFGLSILTFGIYLLAYGFTWPLGGRERAIDTLVMALFGPQYAPIAMAAFFIGLGFFATYKGLQLWRRNV